MKYEEKLFGYYIDFATNCDQPFEKWVKEIWSETESYILEPNAKQQLTEVMWEHHPDWLEEGEKVVILNIYKVNPKHI